MNKDEQLQRLLRLKRHELPPEGFAEEFLEKFQRRQRSELVRRSTLSIVAERVGAWLDGLRRPAVIWGAVAAYAAVMLTLWLVPRHTPQSNMAMVIGTENSVAPQVSFTPGTAPAASNNSTSITNPASFHDPLPPPGKRRTTGQPQDKAPIIGPDANEEKPTDPPLRDL